VWIYAPSPFAQEAAASSWESALPQESVASLLASSVTWRGKHTRKQSWLRVCKKESWTTPLFGRISRPLTLARGAERWISSLAGTRASLARHSSSPKTDIARSTRFRLEMRFSPTSEGGDQLTPSCAERALLSSEFLLRARRTSPQHQSTRFGQGSSTSTGSVVNDSIEIQNGQGPTPFVADLSVRFFRRKGQIWGLAKICGGLSGDISQTAGACALRLKTEKEESLSAAVGARRTGLLEDYAQQVLLEPAQSTEQPSSSKSLENGFTTFSSHSGTWPTEKPSQGFATSYPVGARRNSSTAIFPVTVTTTRVGAGLLLSVSASLTVSPSLLNGLMESLALSGFSECLRRPRLRGGSLISGLSGVSTFQIETAQLSWTESMDGSSSARASRLEAVRSTTSASKRMSPTSSRMPLFTTASLSRSPVRGSASPTPDTSGPTSAISSPPSSPLFASSRTSTDTSHSDTETSEQTWKSWVTALRRRCSQRKKFLLRTAATDSSSWPTAAARESRAQNLLPFSALGGGSKGDASLPMLAAHWMTPMVPSGGRSVSAVTVTSKGVTAKGKTTVGLESQVRRAFSLPDQTTTKPGSTSSPHEAILPLLFHIWQREGLRKYLRLNPSFVEWLMGWPQDWSTLSPIAPSGYKCWEMASSRSLLASLSAYSQWRQG
jgi:hypothetical protein